MDLDDLDIGFVNIMAYIFILGAFSEVILTFETINLPGNKTKKEGI